LILSRHREQFRYRREIAILKIGFSDADSTGFLADSNGLGTTAEGTRKTGTRGALTGRIEFDGWSVAAPKDGTKPGREWRRGAERELPF